MQGVIAAVPTPVNTGGMPIRALFEEHCDWALTHGCDGLNILGSTGEANSLDSGARREVMKWAAASCPRERLMVGTGTPALAETIALTEAADDLGYSVALVLPPYYYAPISDAGLVAWYMALNAGLGARSIQIFFYNFPQMTGLTIPVSVIADLAKAAPGRFTGIKDSSGDLDYCRRIVRLGMGLHVFPSSETVLPHAKADGFAGCISASVNITAPLCAKVWAGPTAASVPEEIARQRAALAGANLIPGVKHMVAHRTGDEAWRRTLPPFLPLPAATADALEQAMSAH
ncbi:dihydrodipicolinate synthase family protein [Gymnodinialimonas sp. 2305UL16-5]|uniref:dihydrodipicolinate synthase family protein n=1 Tax=Gymnodinialimonas mytili TaxID=3126503 RepID=UPI00309CF52B